MASITRSGTGWRAQVYSKGQRASKIFARRQEARDWAADMEAQLRTSTSAKGAPSKMTLGEMLERYAREVSPSKRGARWEQLQIERLQRDDPVAKVRLCDLGPEDLAGWRDRRLRDVSAGTVRRERTLLSSALNHARKEWRLIAENPMADVRAPAEPPARDRLPTDAEIERMKFVGGGDLSTRRGRAVHAFLFALETGMRAGEICGLRACDVNRDLRTVHLPRTKNGLARDVPLSSEALRLLEALPQDDPVFGLTSRDLDAAFRAVKARAQIEGLTFHDSRHAAITRLSKKLDVLALARMVGHRDIRMLQVYYNESAADIAARLG